MTLNENEFYRSDVDCDAGRYAGCGSYCCRLLVRLDPDEQVPNEIEGLPPKGYVDKDEKGYCVNFNRKTHHCNIWATRPRVCREYSCNPDPLLQIALREGFVSVVQLARRAVELNIPKDEFITIPFVRDDINDKN
ncbi:MAG: hypothetical protein BMS9Abin36_1914 [Gammaproteobacteria bacterium]|nr:MAG: hypothetical protein BMS9Abin36_1914 [Gammaproteobacteria bacterium]